jgi:hypothetical protein
MFIPPSPYFLWRHVCGFLVGIPAMRQKLIDNDMFIASWISIPGFIPNAYAKKEIFMEFCNLYIAGGWIAT